MEPLSASCLGWDWLWIWVSVGRGKPPCSAYRRREGRGRGREGRPGTHDFGESFSISVYLLIYVFA